MSNLGESNFTASKKMAKVSKADMILLKFNIINVRDKGLLEKVKNPWHILMNSNKFIGKNFRLYFLCILCRVCTK
jgi:hypothetical protein